MNNDKMESATLESMPIDPLSHVLSFLSSSDEKTLRLVSKALKSSVDQTPTVFEPILKIKSLSLKEGVYVQINNTVLFLNSRKQLRPLVIDQKPIKKMVGERSIFFIAKDGSMYGCGDNRKGQLGLGFISENILSEPREITIEHRGCVEPPKHVLNAAQSTFFIMADGTAYGCGFNLFGQLALSEKSDHVTEPRAINLPKGLKQVINNGMRTWFITQDGCIYGCGQNNFGELGFTPDMNACITSYYDYDNSQILWDSLYGDTSMHTSVETELSCYRPIQITDLPGIPQQIISSDSSTWFILPNGAVYACGSNYQGKLGITEDLVRTPARVLIEGQNPKQIISSGSSTWFILPSGAVYACGFNSQGRLGLGITEDLVRTPARVLIEGQNPKQIISSGSSTWFILPSGAVYACGFNSQGRLGLGVTEDSVCTPTRVLIEGQNPIKILTINTSTFFAAYFIMPDGNIYSCNSSLDPEIKSGLVRCPELNLLVLRVHEKNTQLLQWHKQLLDFARQGLFDDETQGSDDKKQSVSHDIRLLLEQHCSRPSLASGLFKVIQHLKTQFQFKDYLIGQSLNVDSLSHFLEEKNRARVTPTLLWACGVIKLAVDTKKQQSVSLSDDAWKNSTLRPDGCLMP